MRPKADANLDQLKELVEQQFISFVTTIFQEVAFEEFVALSFDERMKNYREISDYLSQFLDFPDYQQACLSDFDPNFEVYVITYNSIFPPEWQRKAYRTFLAEDLYKQFGIWQSYISAIKQGKFQEYLLELYLYKYTDYFYKHWDSFRSYAQKSLAIASIKRKNTSWANRSKLRSVKEQILNFTEPYLHPAPVWSGWKLQDNSQHLLTKEIYKLVGNQLEEYKQINRDWNSRVPENWQKTLLNKFDFEEFFDNAANNSCWNRFFNWVERCCSEKMGLFLCDFHM